MTTLADVTSGLLPFVLPFFQISSYDTLHDHGKVVLTFP